MLEFHHHDAFGRGGGHTESNVHLMCSGHNQLLAEDEYGVEYMQQRRRGETRDAVGSVGAIAPAGAASTPPSDGTAGGS